MTKEAIMVISTVPKLCATLIVSANGEPEMIAAMPRIPIEQAATATGLDPALVAHLIRYEIISGGPELVDVDDIRRIADELNAVRAPYDGVPILISEAAELYGFTSPSIYNWIKAGWVRVLVEQPRFKVDQGDLAVARFLADKIGHVAGRAVFPPKPRSGRPKQPPKN